MGDSYLVYITGLLVYGSTVCSDAKKTTIDKYDSVKEAIEYATSIYEYSIEYYASIYEYTSINDYDSVYYYSIEEDYYVAVYEYASIEKDYNVAFANDLNYEAVYHALRDKVAGSHGAISELLGLFRDVLFFGEYRGTMVLTIVCGMFVSDVCVAIALNHVLVFRDVEVGISSIFLVYLMVLSLGVNSVCRILYLYRKGYRVLKIQSRYKFRVYTKSIGSRSPTLIQELRTCRVYLIKLIKPDYVQGLSHCKFVLKYVNYVLYIYYGDQYGLHFFHQYQDEDELRGRTILFSSSRAAYHRSAEGDGDRDWGYGGFFVLRDVLLVVVVDRGIYPRCSLLGALFTVICSFVATLSVSFSLCFVGVLWTSVLLHAKFFWRCGLPKCACLVLFFC